MEPTVKRIPDDPQVRILDADGRTIGVITSPVDLVVLGPGRETVYLARPAESTPHAA